LAPRPWIDSAISLHGKLRCVFVRPVEGNRCIDPTYSGLPLAGRFPRVI
jgi:hypothetical protein